MVARGREGVEGNGLGKSQWDTQMRTGHRTDTCVAGKGGSRGGHGVRVCGSPAEQHCWGPSQPDTDPRQDGRRLPTAGLLLLPIGWPTGGLNRQRRRRGSSIPSLLLSPSSSSPRPPQCSILPALCRFLHATLWEGTSMSLDLFLFVTAQAWVTLSL